MMLLKKESYSKGVLLSKKGNDLKIDIYVVVSAGVKISEVIMEAQKRVKYTVEKSINMDVKEVNITIKRVAEETKKA